MGAAVYVGDQPEMFITPDGIVHLVYQSGNKRFERIFPVDDYEAFLAEASAMVAEWRAANPGHAARLSTG